MFSLFELWPVLVLFFIWLTALTFFLGRTIWHYRRLTKDVKKKDLKSLLEDILKKSKLTGEELEKLAKDLKKTEKDSLKHIQKVGFLRYNPFADTGGDQSFVLALLDKEDNGFVLSSFHGREGTRIYAKSVKKGKGENFSLSDEEKKVIKQVKTKK